MVEENKENESITEELEKKRREFQNEVVHKKPVARKKKAPRKKLIIGLIILTALLAGLTSAGLYALWFSPERAVSDAIFKALSSKTLSFSGTLTAGNTLDVQFSGATIGSQGSKLTFNSRLSINSQTNSSGGDAVLDKDGNVYVSATGMKNVLGEEAIKDASVEGSYANILLKKLDGRWVKITSTDLQPYHRTLANIQSCLQTVIQRNQGEGPIFQEAAEIYQRNRFIIVDNVAGHRGATTGYAVHLDEEKLKAFLGDFKSSVLYRQLHDCDSATFELSPEKMVSRITQQTNGLVLWIDQAHEIKEIYSRGSVGSMGSELRIAPQFNQETKIVVPTSTITLPELRQYMLDANQAQALSDKNDMTSQKLLQELKDKLKAL